MKKLLLITVTVIFIQISNAQTGTIDYFGQTPPGDSAVVFARGIISLTDRMEGSIAFTPDGNECYFGVFEFINNSSVNKILYSKCVNNTWTKIEEAEFSIGQNAWLIRLSLDGNRIFFEKDGDIWKVERITGGWGEPQRLPAPINSTSAEYGYTETADGTIYIDSNRPGGFSQYCDIWRIRPSSVQAENLGPIVNSTISMGSPCIAPDGSYLIFSQKINERPYLVISFNKGNGGWTVPMDMDRSGAGINIHNQDSPTLSPDGKYLFFRPHSGYPFTNVSDIYWVSTHILDTLKKIAFAPKLKRQIPNMNIKTDSVINYVIPGNTFSCEYGVDSLQYLATLSNGSALPSWLAFNAGTRTLSGTPRRTEIDTIKITATNRDTVSAICSFRITVTASTGQETVTDIDGNVYQTITIGTQVWMKENLKTTRYRNGDTIGTTYPAMLDYRSENTPKYQWAYDGNDSIAAIYGRLYTWYAVTDNRNIAPIGWHVSTDAEWITLVNFLGGADIAGDKLKEAGTAHWKSPNTGATNESGFTALPGGSRYAEGLFMGISEFVHFWTATELEGDNRWAWRWLLYNSSIAERGYCSKVDGWAVRCIKDAGTGVDDSKNENQIPDKMKLLQNYPNPFNPSTVISYRLSVFSNVKLTIYNLLGQKIKTLVNSFQNAGEHSLVWDATDETNNPVSSGMYFYKLETNEMSLLKKMILVR